MCAVVSSNDGKRYQTPGGWSQAGAVMVGLMANSMVKQTPQGMGSTLLKGMKNLSQSMDTVELRKAIDSAMDVSGMKEKGIELIDLKDSNSKFNLKSMFKFPLTSLGEGAETIGKQTENVAGNTVAIPNYKLKKALMTEMPAWLRKTPLGKTYVNIIETMLTDGNNAAYLPKSNKIAVNIEKIGAATFHEIGHAVNKQSSKFWRAMQKTRTPLIALASAFPLVGIIKRKKVEGEEPKNVVDKATTFIKDNCGVLTTAAFVPVVAEEMKATQRGNKLAKQLLSKQDYLKVVKSNRLGAISYIAVGICAGAGAFIGSKVRDFCSKPKEIKEKIN